jgi:DNA-binding transcriptional regulator YhcF (GntR family)
VTSRSDKMSAGSPPKYARAAAIVRDQIAAGQLAPGEPAPSAAALARATGFASLTCRKGLRTLIKDGTLVPGPSRNARPRVAARAQGGRASAEAARALSAALAARRRAAGLTQVELAALVGFSVTTVGHAETGRTWQSRRFWEQIVRVLCVGGELLDLHDAYRAAVLPPESDAAFGLCQPSIKGEAHMDDYLRKRMLAVNVLLEIPEAIPDGLESELYAYRDKLEAEALST